MPASGGGEVPVDAWVWILIAVVVVAVIAAIVWATWTKRRTTMLRQQFGPEYDRTIAQSDGRRSAEGELSARRERRAELDIRPLSPAARERYAEAWRNVQAGFVDEPTASLLEAGRLVLIVMRERGYPMDDFEQRVADVSVDHPEVVEHYRIAHAISADAEDHRVTTEDIRQGLMHYRALFARLLEANDEQLREAR
jgi:hypothetical protein